MPTYTRIKKARGQYQVIDENGVEQFQFPTSKHKAGLFIIEHKTDERFLADKNMQQVAKAYINDRRLPVSAYGDLRQFMLNSIYNMYHGDIRSLMQSKSRYREHLLQVSERNRAARQESITEKLPMQKIIDVIQTYFNKLGNTLPLSSEVPNGLINALKNAI